MVDGINDICSSQKVRLKLCKLLGCPDKAAAGPDHSRFRQRCLIYLLRPFPHARQRKKGCTSITVPLQIFNHLLCRCLITGDNILNTASQCCLNGNLILFIDLNQVCHNSKQTGFFFLFFHYATNGVPITVITLGNVNQRLQPGLLPVITRRVLLQIPGRLRLFLLPPFVFLL